MVARADVAAALDLPDDDEAVRVRRPCLAHGEPLAVMSNHLPLAIAPSGEELTHEGLHDCLRGRGVHPHIARQRIGAWIARAAES